LFELPPAQNVKNAKAVMTRFSIGSFLTKDQHMGKIRPHVAMNSCLVLASHTLPSSHGSRMLGCIFGIRKGYSGQTFGVNPQESSKADPQVVHNGPESNIKANSRRELMP
jgi:hypothetical protein